MEPDSTAGKGSCTSRSGRARLKRYKRCKIKKKTNVINYLLAAFSFAWKGDAQHRRGIKTRHNRYLIHLSPAAFFLLWRDAAESQTQKACRSCRHSSGLRWYCRYCCTLVVRVKAILEMLCSDVIFRYSDVIFGVTPCLRSAM